MNFKSKVNKCCWIKLKLRYQKYITTYEVLHFCWITKKKKFIAIQRVLNTTPNWGNFFVFLAMGKAVAFPMLSFMQLLFYVLAKRWMRCKSKLLSFIVDRQRSVDLFAPSSERRDENCDRICVLERVLRALLQRRLFFKIESTVDYDTR